MENAIKILEISIWPITLIIILHFFNSELKMTIKRISTLSHKGTKVEFHKELEVVQEEIKSLNSSEKKDTNLNYENEEYYSRITEIATISPKAAILDAWREVEILTKTISIEYKIFLGGNIAGIKAIRELVEKKYLETQVIGIYENLRKIRAKVAHSHEYQLDYEEVDKYLASANVLYLSLKKLEKKN